MNKKILITGGAGFIGSHLVRHFVEHYPNYLIVNLDSLTYCGNLTNLKDIEDKPNYVFEKKSITSKEDIEQVLHQYNITDIINLAAESHVDRSILNPLSFVETNVLGTVNLLQCAKTYWNDDISRHIFFHISTDEVYGSLGDEGYFTETTPYQPNSPYSASKASSDHFVRAYGETFHLPYLISNCSNNYGPYQFPEKLIPLTIHNMVNNKKVPIYGKGTNVRDWLFVTDHVLAIDKIFHNAKPDSTYNIGTNNEWKNIDLVLLMGQLIDQKLGRPQGTSKSLIEYVQDRPGHDKRYAIDSSKLRNELNWKPQTRFEEGLSLTIDWYLNNPQWVADIVSGSYQQYYEQQYHSLK